LLRSLPIKKKNRKYTRKGGGNRQLGEEGGRRHRKPSPRMKGEEAFLSGNTGGGSLPEHGKESEKKRKKATIKPREGDVINAQKEEKKPCSYCEE